LWHPRAACREWWEKSTTEEKMLVWDRIQVPHPNDPVAEIVTRFAQLAFAEMAAENSSGI
jgi:hypothetical protein